VRPANLPTSWNLGAAPALVRRCPNSHAQPKSHRRAQASGRWRTRRTAGQWCRRPLILLQQRNRQPNLARPRLRSRRGGPIRLAEGASFLGSPFI
jgi:hypothetical protein